jgi:hypothetical protein
MLVRSDRRVRMVDDLAAVEVDVVGRPQARRHHGQGRREGKQSLGRDQPGAFQGRQV